jgi:hypothetical protein
MAIIARYTLITSATICVFWREIDMAGGDGEISGRRESASTGNPLDGPGDRCPSCAEPGRGRYCSACGERFLADHDFSLRHFFLETLPHEVFDIDGKFLRTLRLLLLRPGMLASEYVAGRRQRYVGPLRFYVIVFLLHATLAALLAGHGPSLSEHIRENDPTQLLVRLASSRPGVNWNDPEFRASLSERGRWFAEIGTMLIFLGIAALQKLVFFRSGRRYLEHVALSLNIVSFYIVVLLLVEVGLGIFGRSHFADYDIAAQQWAGATLLPVYWFLAIRRFYGLRGLPSLLGALIMWVGHALIALCMNLLVLALLIETA